MDNSVVFGQVISKVVWCKFWDIQANNIFYNYNHLNSIKKYYINAYSELEYFKLEYIPDNNNLINTIKPVIGKLII